MAAPRDDLLGMVDISPKDRTHRVAVAECFLVGPEALLDRVERGDVPKGAVLPVARAAALSAVKTTHLAIPHCHPVAITGAEVGFQREPGRLRVTVRASAVDRTGVEMEALHACATCALTIYDLAKFAGESLRIDGLRLVSKRGGKSDIGPT